jgi:hypothetical protein
LGAWENVVGIKQGEKENRDRFNGSPRLCPPLDKERKKKEKILTIPSPYPLPRGGEGERAKFFKDTSHFYSLLQGERREKKNLTESPSPLPSPTEWKGEKKGEKGIKKNLLN